MGLRGAEGGDSQRVTERRPKHVGKCHPKEGPGEKVRFNSLNPRVGLGLEGQKGRACFARQGLDYTNYFLSLRRTAALDRGSCAHPISNGDIAWRGDRIVKEPSVTPALVSKKTPRAFFVGQGAPGGGQTLLPELNIVLEGGHSGVRRRSLWIKHEKVAIVDIYDADHRD